MDLRLQPKPQVEYLPVDKGIVSRKQFFVKKKFEKINQYFFPGHLIRDWKPKAELIYPPAPDETAIQYEYDFNREVQNCFVEDYAEEVYVRTPPPCFVIFGKFKREVNNLCKYLAQEYGSVLIQADDIVQQVIRTKTETSKLVDKILRLGVSLTLNFILALMSFVAHTTEARHRGYVLSGLPCIPVSYDLSPEQQFNYLFTWDNKPTVFIYVLFNDEDLIQERPRLGARLIPGERGQNELVNFLKPKEEEESESEDEMLPIKENPGYEPNINVSPSTPSVQLPRNKECVVWCELELYNNIISPVLKLINSRVDPQYMITVDSRVGNEFELVKARLSLLQIWKPPVAVPFFSHTVIAKERTEEAEENNEKEREIETEKEETEMSRAEQHDSVVLKIAEATVERSFLELFSKITISPKFRWELSHYNYICPVSLRAGEIVEGKPQFAVIFLKYIYFLRDDESKKKFIQNPRAYVLPIRPKPLCRFIILGYPFSGRTTLAEALSQEYSIPLIDFTTILENDLERKKNTYREFCRKKAECRETIRLTTRAWQEWRVEEEKRIELIEEWILYIQSILTKRIDQFYTVEPEESITEKELSHKSSEEGNIKPECSETSGETRNSRTEEENANLFFSSLWNCFSDEKPKTENLGEQEEFGEYGAYHETYGEGGILGEVSSEEHITVDWCNYLPPQSLSSFLMSKKPYTTREKRQSFKYFLDAASKAYWAPSALKSEFAKWRLPCFMDISLCEIFLDNPILLLKYVPIWLQERPLIPEPIDSTHPSVVEASKEAYNRAAVVNVKQSEEEMGILLRDAIEKAEREGMRVTGEVISPGGWVVDNMTLDLKVWSKLTCENVFADHIYFLIDTEPDYYRIINLWWEICGGSLECSYNGSSEEEEEEKPTEFPPKKLPSSQKRSSEDPRYLIKLLLQTVKIIAEGEETLDDLFRALRRDDTNNLRDTSSYFIANSINWPADSQQKTPAEYTITTLIETITSFNSRENFPESWKMLVGVPLETFTDAILNCFKKKSDDETKPVCESEDGLKFFTDLLTLPKRITDLKEWLTAIGRGSTIQEIEITGKTPEAVFEEIRNVLMAPFIKKPRELEDFEIDEIQKSTPKPEVKLSELELDVISYGTQNEVADDIRIFGESGPLCVVNLERDIYLPGKLEYSLRYYGKLYYFWNQEAKDKFIEDPEKYAPYYSAIRCYPPLRIFVMGASNSGKTTLAKYISRECGLPYVDHLKFLFSKIVPHCTTETSSKMVNDESNEPAKQLKKSFLNASILDRQFWIENSSQTELFDDDFILRKLEELQNPMSYQDYPELTYNCVESLINENSNEEELENNFTNTPNPLPEVPHVSMKELETVITNYLSKGEELPDYCWEKTFKTLWTTEPYISQGFVIDNFYKLASDIKFTIPNNWLPDLLVEINTPLETITNRSIDNMMENWDNELNQEIIEEKTLETTLTNIQNLMLSNRRIELIKKKEAKEAQKLEDELTRAKSSILNKADLEQTSTSTQDQESEFALKADREDPNIFSKPVQEPNIEDILNKEFPPLVFNPIFETYEDKKAKTMKEIETSHQQYETEIEKTKSDLKDLNIPWLVVDGKKDLKEILSELHVTIDAIRKRPIKGEFAFTLTMKMAGELLKQGYYFLSKFGKWCPVQIYRMKNPIHMFRPYKARNRITPIAYRNYIYFVAGENEKNKFLEDPIKYTFNEPHHPNIPLRVAIIGPPKCGKTTLSTRLGLMFDLKVITMGSALRFALERAPQSTLAKSIDSYLRRGCFLPLSLKVEALMIALNDPSCVTQGFVFDGVPFDAALTQSLAERGKLPFVIISLVGDTYFGKCNREDLDLKQFRLPYKNRVNLDLRYDDWGATYKRFVQWNEATYNNLYELDAKSNVVSIFYKAYDIIRKSYFGILNYVEYCVSGRVAPLEHLCVSQHEYDLRKSALCNNCPVCWVEKGKLSNSSDPPPRSGLVQYKKHFYWICPQHMEKFVKNPRRYFLPYAPKWPEVMARKLNKWETKSKENVHGYGRCPVTRIDFPDSLDWEGSWNFAAEYAGAIFLCKNEEMLDRFLSQPWRYYQADTKFEAHRSHKSSAVENLGPPVITSLPPIGFLEQTVADMIHECLQLLGTVRPIYPNMSPSVTGCIFVALYLKAHNKKNKASHLEKQYLGFMLKSCTAFGFKVQTIQYQDSPEGSYTEYAHRDETSPEGSQKSDGTSQNLQYTEFHESVSKGDFEGHPEMNLWGAKKIKETHVHMLLTPDDTLIEIPKHPKIFVVLRYKYNFRTTPIPPISDCLSFIYSPKPNVQIPEKFDFRTLYQPPLTDFFPAIPLHLHKQFGLTRYQETEASQFPSATHMLKGPRTYSQPSMADFKEKKLTESKLDASYMRERFLPRFQLLDTVKSVEVPSLPKVVPQERILYDPALDYTYAMLYSEFFGMTHVLKCYRTDEIQQHMEYSYRLDEDLGLAPPMEFLFPPKVTASMRSTTSLESYQRIFDAASTFVVGKYESEVSSEGESSGVKSSASSIFDFIQSLIEERIEAIFTEVSDDEPTSEDTFEISTPTKRKIIVFREVLPYPPLSWDIISKPYHAYVTVSAVFNKFPMTFVRHERRFSLLDGIPEPQEIFRFIELSEEKKLPRLGRCKKSIKYFYYDFFNLPWASFLTYPHNLIFTTPHVDNSDMKDNESSRSSVFL